MHDKNGPVRTCISCGVKKNKYELIRLVLNEKGYVVKDHRMNMPGRGAYICNTRDCHVRLLKNKKLNRRFRKTSEVRLAPELEYEIKKLLS